MPVVSDADVIIHLSKLRKLFLLRLLYSEIAIPEYVKTEISGKVNDDIKDALASFLRVYPTSAEKAEIIAKRHGIHTGEAHVKTLGEELEAQLFLSNERKVRLAAKEEGFKVAGTIGIILKAAKSGKIERVEARAMLESMKADDFRIRPELIQEALSVLEEL